MALGEIESLKTKDRRTNFLILGLGGPKNQPSSLTDTQQFFSYDHTQERHILLSIPRDIWIPNPGVKINGLYSYGNSTEGSGIDLTKNAVTEITGQPVHYSVMVSFEGFVRFVDLLGGVNVNVERSFTDTQYPIKGKENDPCDGDPEFACRWETISFKKGKSHFDGETALKFVRSRHARGDEGTDFARAARQQKIMLGIKDKILSPGFFFNPQKIEQVLGLTAEVFESDIPAEDFGVVVQAFLRTKREKVQTNSLVAMDPENPDENLTKPAFLIHPAISPLYKNQWVLIPVGGNWKATHAWIDCLIKGNECSPEKFAPKIKPN